jgi:hypothetical protein
VPTRRCRAVREQFLHRGAVLEVQGQQHVAGQVRGAVGATAEVEARGCGRRYLVVRRVAQVLEEVDFPAEQLAVPHAQQHRARLVAVTRHADDVGVAAAHVEGALPPLQRIEPVQHIAQRGGALEVEGIGRTRISVATRVRTVRVRPTSTSRISSIMAR